MAEIEYEVLHKNVYYFPGIIQDIEHLMKTLDEVNSLSVTPWETWYANNSSEGYPYGDLKVLSYAKLDQETDPDVKEKSSYILNSILGSMETAAAIFMKAHGASQEELDHLHGDIFGSTNVYGIRKYNENEDMGPHPDRVEEHTDTYTIAVYLDDAYDGGELGIVQPGIDILIKNKAGSIVVFPSGYLHESKKLTNGRKTIITHVHTTLKPMIEF